MSVKYRLLLSRSFSAKLIELRLANVKSWFVFIWITSGNKRETFCV